MIRGDLCLDEYKPQFAGHETFPLRYGWLKKAFDAIYNTENLLDNRDVFGDRAIADFGVGKNMVAAMRFWATVAGVIHERDDGSRKGFDTTLLGRKIFGPDGWDPYMEHPATLWLMHWQLAARPSRTTWYWAFSHYHDTTFERDQLVEGLVKLAVEQKWSRSAPATIKRDVECFVRTYAARSTKKNVIDEDMLECPLTELGLIRSVGRNAGFRLVRGPKLTLPSGVFVHSLVKFWERFSTNAQTLSFEAIAHEPGSPGRTFLLSENDLVDRLTALDDISNGALGWSESAGLKQVIRTTELKDLDTIEFMTRDYVDVTSAVAA